MITVKEYLTQHAAPDAAPFDVVDAASVLIPKVNDLLSDPTCPHPEAGLRSGYRPAVFNATVANAAPNSKHQTGHAVDLNDDDGELDDWLTDVILEKYGLWREHPAATKSWCHVQDQPPKSGKRTFYP